MAFKDAQENGNFCPFRHKKCIESQCVLWTHVRGKHPQSEEEIDKYGCAIAWLPVLLIENAQRSNQIGAAVESMRNVIITEGEKNRKAMKQAVEIEMKKIGGVVDNAKSLMYTRPTELDAEFEEKK